MKGGGVRRLTAAGTVLVFRVALVGSAAADPPAFTVSNAAGTEGGVAQFTVTLGSPAPPEGVELTYSTANGSAGGSDYTAVSNGSLSFAQDETTKTIDIALTNDTLDEDAEDFSVTVAHAEGGDQTGTGTINDNDAPPSTTGITDVTVTEGDSGTVNANFTVGLSGASGKAITINYSTVNGSAIAPGDYTAEINQNLTINPGQTSGVISIAVNGDTASEGNESFTVNLNSGVNVTVTGDTQAVGTITDDDNEPNVTIGDVAVTETEGNVPAVFQVTLSAPAPGPVAIAWTATDGSATAGNNDYTAVSGTLNIPTNGTGGTITVQVEGDSVAEPTENFHVDLTSATGAQLQADRRGTATITDDDSQPTVTIGDVAVTETEGNVAAVFQVSLSPAAPGPVTIAWTTTDGSATAANNDYTADSGTLNIGTGGTGGTITVQVEGDGVAESTESFHVDLTGATGAQLQADRRGTATITDDDSSPTVTIGDVTVTETEGNVPAVFQVTLSGPAPAPVAIAWTTTDGTATAAGNDYEAASGTLNIPTNGTGGTITVQVEGDAVAEATQNFHVDLQSATGAQLQADRRGTATINDDDSQQSVSSISDPVVTEGNTGQVDAAFVVTLSANASTPVSIGWTTTDGSASAASGDYVGASGTLAIPVGQRTGTITIKVNGDVIPEGASETFHVDLTSYNGVQPGADGRGTATITDDDTPPTVTIADAPAVPEGNTGEVDASFVVTLSANPAAAVSIGWTTTDGSARGDSDYTAASGTLVIPAGTQRTGTITIKVKGDTLPEGTSENFHVDLTSATGAQLAEDTRGTATITDDDAPPSVASISDPTVNEGHTGEADASFVVTLSANAPAPVSIGWTTTDESATSPSDYTGGTGTLAIAAGQRTGTITIKVKGDALPEENEKFHVDLTSFNGVQQGADGRGTATITNDDAAAVPSVQDASTQEGNVTVNIRVTQAASGQTVNFNYRTVEGTATASGSLPDYNVAGGGITFTPGATERTIPISIRADALDENDESFTIEITRPSDGAVVARGTVTIRDDDNNSLVSVSNAEANEGATGATSTMTFKVTLAPASARTVKMNFGTVNGTATAGSDYTAASGALEFAPGESEKTIVVTVLGDDINEENETVLVDVSAVTGAKVADAQGLGTIVDKNAPPSLSIDDTQTREGDGATFTVTLAGTTLRTVTVTFSTVESTAKEGTDYSPRRGTLTFAPGEKTKTVAVTVIDDTASETVELFSVDLGDPVNAVITKRRGVATIEASDQVTPTGRPPTPPPPPNLPVPTPKTNGKAVFPRMVLGPRSLTLTPVGRARMQITCAKNSKVTCTGRIVLENAAKTPKLTLGQRRFTVKKGKQLYLPVTLSDRAFALVQKNGVLRARAVVVITTGGKTYRFVPGVITIHATKNPEPRVAVDPKK